jgi:thioester reductase-like protein
VSVERRILITGATGQFGRHLARELLRSSIPFVAVIRARSDAEAASRLARALGLPELPMGAAAVAGDTSKADLGLTRAHRRAFRRSIGGVIHSAASTSFTAPVVAALEANAGGTQNVLDYASGLEALNVFVHVSTAFVAGRRVGRILESELEHDSGFMSTYDRSKYAAELLVTARARSLPVVVVRPSVILDHSNGRASGGGAGLALALVARGGLRLLPGTPESRVDMVDAGVAATAIVELTLRPSPGAVYHVAGGDGAPTAGDIVRSLGPRAGVRFCSEHDFRAHLQSEARRRPRTAPMLGELAGFLPYLAYPKVFDTTTLERDLGVTSIASRAVGQSQAEARDPVRRVQVL